MSSSNVALIDQNLIDLLEKLREGSAHISTVTEMIQAWTREHQAGAEQISRTLQSAMQRGELSPLHHHELVSALSRCTAQNETFLRAPAAIPRVDETQMRAAATSLRGHDPRAAETHPHGTDAASAPSWPLSNDALNPGVVIGRRYVLENLLGSGGMGQVWKAKDLRRELTRDPNPHVAIKLLSVDFEANPKGLVSLERETRKAQDLAHPNVCTAYDFDIDEGGSGRAFMSMELLEGTTLDALICSHPSGLARAQAITLILGMARGLKYAHEKGIVHSDLKPCNVFVIASGVPKLLDFGIARAAKVAGVEREEDSFDAGSLGALTLYYASPEMFAHGEPHTADDVFALGLVAYELLTGRPPFDRLTAVEARERHLKPARIRSLRYYQWHSIARALEFDRSKRWQNAGEFLRAFEGKSAVALALGAVALSLAIAAGIFWYQGYVASRPAVPFEALTPDVQAEFREHMANADGEWRLVQKGMADESLDAASEYGRAYALHPRNPDATAGLKKSADYILKRLQRVADPTERLHNLKSLQDISKFYSDYQPVVEAIEEAGGGK
jgi:hypothetical protein